MAILVAEGYDSSAVSIIKKALMQQGVSSKLVAKTHGKLKASDGSEMEVDEMFVTTASVVFDAVLVAPGKASVEKLRQNGNAIHFLNESFRHCKPIGAYGTGIELLQKCNWPEIELAKTSQTKPHSSHGVVTGVEGNAEEFAAEMIKAIAQHRFWDRTMKDMVPA